MTTATRNAQKQGADYDRSVDRWARWFHVYDRLPRPIRRLIPRRFL